MAIRDVLLLSNEPNTITAVSGALSSNGQLAQGNIFARLADIITRLERGGVPAVLLDVDSQPEGLFHHIEPLARKFVDTKFIAIAGDMRQELLFEAMAVGVRHVLLKSAITTDLSQILHRLCPDGGTAGRGLVVTVLSAGGGSGGTTLSVNLAAELPQDNGSPNLVIDLDASYGAVGTYLGLDGEYGVVDLLNRTGHFDSQLIQSTALTGNPNLHAMLSTPKRHLGRVASLTSDRIGEFADACKGAYKWSVIDAPRVSLDVAAALASRSHVTLIPMQLMIKDIQVARQILSGLTERGVSTGRVMVLVNRYRKRGYVITLEEAARAIGLSESQPLTTLSNDFAAVTEAANLGKPLMAVSPRSDYRRDVQKLAGMIAALPQLHSIGRAASLLSAV